MLFVCLVFAAFGLNMDNSYAVELNENGNVTIQDLAEAMGVTEKTVRNRIKEHGGFWIDEGNVGRKN